MTDSLCFTSVTIMGKRDEQRKLKLCILSKMYENKDVLFGAFSDKLTKQDKIEKWKIINNCAVSLGVVPSSKDWSYVRAVWWPNVRKSATEKVDNFRKTDTGGGKNLKLNEIDEQVLNIIGKDSPTVLGLGVSETWESKNPIENEQISVNEIVVVESEDNLQVPQTSANLQNTITSIGGTKRKWNGKKVLVEVDEEKHRLQTELLKIQIYNSKLETRKLGIPKSIYTEDFTRNIDTEFMLNSFSSA